MTLYEIIGDKLDSQLSANTYVFALLFLLGAMLLGAFVLQPLAEARRKRISFKTK